MTKMKKLVIRLQMIHVSIPQSSDYYILQIYVVCIDKNRFDILYLAKLGKIYTIEHSKHETVLPKFVIILYLCVIHVGNICLCIYVHMIYAMCVYIFYFSNVLLKFNSINCILCCFKHLNLSIVPWKDMAALNSCDIHMYLYLYLCTYIVTNLIETYGYAGTS